LIIIYIKNKIIFLYFLYFIYYNQVKYKIILFCILILLSNIIISFYFLFYLIFSVFTILISYITDSNQSVLVIFPILYSYSNVFLFCLFFLGTTAIKSFALRFRVSAIYPCLVLKKCCLPYLPQFPA
jgi:hypothetical protein